MHSTSLYGEYYTKVFYISLCLNGRAREETFKHPIFVLKRAAKAMQNCPKIKQQCKDKDNFRNCKFYSTFFFLLRSNHHLIKKSKIIWIVNYSLYLCIRKQTIKPYV